MGASSSVSIPNGNNRKNNTYLSYTDGDTNAEHLHDELLNSGYNIVKENFLRENDFTIKQYQDMVKDIMSQSKNIVVCVSEKTVMSFSQAIEINIALDKDDTNIVYIFTDEDFTPTNMPYLNGLVGNNIWLPAYDATTMSVAIETMETYGMLS
jgi:hypothetical protein